MNIADDDLTNITDDWSQWPVWSRRALVRKARNRWICVTPHRQRWAIIAGPLNQPGAFTDIWIYTSAHAAINAADAWTGTGEPHGWIHHPRTRRQRLAPREP